MSGLWQQWKYRFCTGKSEKFSSTWSNRSLYRYFSSFIMNSSRVRPACRMIARNIPSPELFSPMDGDHDTSSIRVLQNDMAAGQRKSRILQALLLLFRPSQDLISTA